MPSDFPENLPPRSRMWATIALALCLASLVACGRSSSSNEAANTAPASSAPLAGRSPQAPAEPSPLPLGTNQQAEQTETGWTTLDNRRAKPSDFHGQVLVLDFYATWCPPCRQEVPHLVALQNRFGPEGLRIVGLNVGGEDDRDKVPEFVKEFGIQYKLGFPDDEMAELFLSDDDSIPQTYVFDRQGRLIKRFIGYDERMDAALERTVQRALAANAPEENGIAGRTEGGNSSADRKF